MLESYHGRCAIRRGILGSMTDFPDPGLASRLAALDAVWVHPEIPARKERNARASHRIPDGEPIWLLYDDTLFGGGSDGVVLTSERFSVKSAFEPSRPVPYTALGTVETAEKTLWVAGLEVSFTVWTPEHARLIAETLELLRRRERTSWTGFLQKELTGALGSLDEAFLAPSIPERKERTVRAVHGIPDGERVLALYDDTVFGGAKEGWVFTDRRFAWKDLFEDPEYQAWGEVCRPMWLEPPKNLADALPGLLEHVWRSRELLEPRNHELEAAILADPDALEPRLVLSDWLQEQNHPRGELIGLQVRDPGPSEAQRALFERDRLLIGAYEPGGHLQVTWKLGFWDTVTLGFQEGTDDWKAPRWFERVLTHPSARFLRSLALNGAPNLRPDAVRRAIAAMEPYRQGYSEPEVQLDGKPLESLRR